VENVVEARFYAVFKRCARGEAGKIEALGKGLAMRVH
jgi:hypothetical protein